MLTELLRPAGPDLARRWVAALMIAPPEEREEIVEAIETKMASLYGLPGERRAADEPTLLHFPGERVQKDGFVEQVVRSYAASIEAEGEAGGRGTGRSSRADRAG